MRLRDKFDSHPLMLLDIYFSSPGFKSLNISLYDLYDVRMKIRIILHVRVSSYLMHKYF